MSGPIAALKQRLAALEVEKAEILAALRHAEQVPTEAGAPALLGTPLATDVPVTNEAKLAFFLQVFAARRDVFPQRWASGARQGYSPVCLREWERDVCLKPQVKCSACEVRQFQPLDETVARAHLEGRLTIGTYAIQPGDTCIFLACDFDEAAWEQDVLAYRNAGKHFGIEVVVERSRSGNGAHAWVFFSQPVSARDARLLGTLLLLRCQLEGRSEKLSSFDRFFPNQDTLPKGGFGNLIALPLQKEPREHGNSVFVDEALKPYPNQWEYLAEVRSLSAQDLQELCSTHGLLPGEHPVEEDQDVAMLVTERAVRAFKPDPGLLTFPVQATLGAELCLPLPDLPPRFVAALKRLATFPNPEFFKAQRLRFSTWKLPRLIQSFNTHGRALHLPRGLREETEKLCDAAGGTLAVTDARTLGNPLSVTFAGTLRPEQMQAVETIEPHDLGLLVAPTGGGKTVMACALIARRGVSTLILVHRKELLLQWQTSLKQFLAGLGKRDIGLFGGTRKRLTGIIDVAMMQTLANAPLLGEVSGHYGQVIVDECHHVPAVTFEKTIAAFPARYICGLTATPYRKDGHQAILHIQCGPIRHTMKDDTGGDLQRILRIRPTGWMPPNVGERPPIHEVWAALIQDTDRNILIVADIQAAYHQGAKSVVFSDRKEHLERLAEKLREQLGPEGRVYILRGDNATKVRRATLAAVATHLENGEPFLLLSTTSLIGEGLDLPGLDTLFLAMPISFKGRLIQAVGRLHRPAEGKSQVTVYDYFDTSTGLTISMFRRRLTVYRQQGYQFEPTGDAKVDRFLRPSGGKSDEKNQDEPK